MSGEETDTFKTDITGYFEFSDLPIAGDYEITPGKNVFHSNGVSTFDLVFMKRHILGIQAINSPYKIIAADVNNSGNVSTFDIVKLRRLILQLDTVFTDNTSWKFIPENYVFPNPANPFMETFPESVLINQLETDLLDVDFVGVKIGDVNGNANTNEFQSSGGEGRNKNGELLLTTTTQEFKAGESIEIPIYSEDFDKILGTQMTFGFDQSILAFAGVESGTLENFNENHFNLSKVDEGLMISSWNRAEAKSLNTEMPLFILKFNAKENGKLKNNFEINARWLNSEAYNDEMEILGINFEFSEPVVAEKEQFMLYQNYPNPFLDETINTLFPRKTTVDKL